LFSTNVLQPLAGTNLRQMNQGRIVLVVLVPSGLMLLA